MKMLKGVIQTLLVLAVVEGLTIGLLIAVLHHNPF